MFSNRATAAFILVFLAIMGPARPAGWLPLAVGSGAVCSPACLGDVVATNIVAYYSVRCWQYAYAGNVIDLVDAATGNTTGTRLQCANGVVSALVSGSACTFVTGNACSALATTCATACNVSTWYDQINGGNNNVTPASNATAPAYVTGVLGSQAGINCIFANTTDLSSPIGGTGNNLFGPQPFTIVLAMKATSVSTTYGWFGGGNADPYIETSSSLFEWSTASAGAQVNAPAAAASTVYSAQFIFNGASSQYDVNGTTATGQNGGTSGLSNNISSNATVNICNDSFHAANGYIGEVAIYSTGSNSQSAINTNLLAFY